MAFGALKNIGKAFNIGLQTGIGTPGRMVKGIPGALGAIGVGAAIGAGIGAGSAAAIAPEVDPLTAGAVGAGIGAAALPTAGLAVGAIGTAGVKLAPVLGKAAVKGVGMASPYLAGGAVFAAGAVANDLYNVGSMLVNMEDVAEHLKAVKLTGPISGAIQGWERGQELARFNNTAGKIAAGTVQGAKGAIFNGKNLLIGTSIASGIKKAWNAYETAKMGTMAGTYNMTPRVPNYGGNGYDDGGATGDLVFALNANRRG